MCVGEEATVPTCANYPKVGSPTIWVCLKIVYPYTNDHYPYKLAMIGNIPYFQTNPYGHFCCSDSSNRPQIWTNTWPQVFAKLVLVMPMSELQAKLICSAPLNFQETRLGLASWRKGGFGVVESMSSGFLKCFHQGQLRRESSDQSETHQLRTQIAGNADYPPSIRNPCWCLLSSLSLEKHQSQSGCSSDNLRFT